MEITGYLSEFSLPELLKFLDQGSKTGLLSLKFKTNCHDQHQRIRHALFKQGRIVAVTDRLDHQGLFRIIYKRGWISPKVLREQFNRCPANQPIGLYLKKQGFLQPEQLKLLFRYQVLRQVCGLFQLENAKFIFNSKTTLPTTEMTSLSIRATEATLIGLRALRDWTPLTPKLPEFDSALSRVFIGKLHWQLDALENQVWQLADDSVSLKLIAHDLQQPPETIQKTAFRLISLGLVTEVPTVAPPTTGISAEKLLEPVAVAASDNEDDHSSDLSSSFMQNLLSFLRSSK
ncbi:MAG: DUF4388 domain-containing protein [Symploca sp. SIO2E9]|nr:DUF4388 domain-containing protein [Symploca sp. SIO2E9]